MTRPSILWVRIDPFMTMPVKVVWTGRRGSDPSWNGMTEAMCAEQLVNDIHISGRMAAAAALAVFNNEHSMKALKRTLDDTKSNFRVRVACAIALGKMVDDEKNCTALDHLIDYVKKMHYEQGQLKSNNYLNSFDRYYYVLKGVIESIGTCRDAEGYTPPKALDFLCEVLDDNDNSKNRFDDGWGPSGGHVVLL